MNQQRNPFKPAPKHRDLLRKRTRPADFGERVQAVLKAFEPAEDGGRGKERRHAYRDRAAIARQS